MSTHFSKRISPSDFESEQEIERLMGAFARSGPVRVIDEDGNEAEVPKALFDFMGRVLSQMQRGRSVTLMPQDEQFTTQAAANYLGMSRQHLVSLLEAGDIPFTKVGTHRRVTFEDLRAYEKRRDAHRTNVLDDLMDEVSEAGLYASTSADGRGGSAENRKGTAESQAG
jgi:excisionase family DNA binding protein